MAPTKAQIRKSIRRQRLDLSAKALQAAANGLICQARRYYPLWTATRVLSYLPFAGEISPMQLHPKLNAELFLPRITNYRTRQMQFYSARNPLQSNHFGILEPAPIGSVSGQSFDLVLLPLVAFNRAGARLGMGAGFYDRAFAFRQRGASTRPRLIGLAHSFQEVESLRADAWDVPLDAIITDQELIPIHPH